MLVPPKSFCGKSNRGPQTKYATSCGNVCASTSCTSEDPAAGYKGRPTKTGLCGQRRHTPCRGKEAEAVPMESEVFCRSGSTHRSEERRAGSASGGGGTR